ncbi:MAG: exosortase A [Rhodoferax sp.]|nr:exosortase A [Rhodoferax sp.]
MNLKISQPMPSISPSMDKVWRQALAILSLLLAWTLFLYRDTGLAMATIWARSETFTHGFLVPPIVLWLIWRQRQAIAAQRPQPSIVAIFAVLVGAFVWLLGDLAAVNAVTQLAFTALLVLLVPAVLGWSVTRLIVFPLVFLFFAVPIGEFLMPQLMEWTADFTVLALRLTGIPVYREGLQFVIPSGNWSVVEACSGVRYLIASLTVGTLFAYLNYQSTTRRVLFVIVSILVPVLANWMRAYIIVMLGHLSGNKLAAGVDHLIYGWLFFGVVIMLMFIIGARWAEPDKVVALDESAATMRLPMPTMAGLSWVSACVAGLLMLPQVTLWAIDGGEGNGSAVLVAPAVLGEGWQKQPVNTVTFKPAFQSPTAEINTSYARQDRMVGIYLGYYGSQSYERKLVSSNNVLVVSNDAQWSQVASAKRSVTLGENKPVDVRTAELRASALARHANAERLVVWQIYWINGTLTANDYLAKVYSAFYRLTGRGNASAVIIVYTSKDQVGGADATLESFLAANYQAINQLLRNRQQSK